jgi:hypothetical protein
MRGRTVERWSASRAQELRGVLDIYEQYDNEQNRLGYDNDFRLADGGSFSVLVMDHPFATVEEVRRLSQSAYADLDWTETSCDLTVGSWWVKEHTELRRVLVAVDPGYVCVSTSNDPADRRWWLPRAQFEMPPVLYRKAFPWELPEEK